MVYPLSPEENHEPYCVPNTQRSKKKQNKLLYFYKGILYFYKGITNYGVTGSIEHPSLGIFGAFYPPCLDCRPSLFSAGLLSSFLAFAFPFIPLGIFSPCFAGSFLGLSFGFGGAGVENKSADLLCISN